MDDRGVTDGYQHVRYEIVGAGQTARRTTDVGPRRTKPLMFTEAHLEQWRTTGYAVVEGFLSEDQLVAARRRRSASVASHLGAVPPTTGTAGPRSLRSPRCRSDGGKVQNQITFRHDLLDFVEQALGTEEILLAHSQVLCKTQTRTASTSRCTSTT